MFTRQTLVRLSTLTSFSRGEGLYADGAVKKLARPAPTRFSARVKGTYSYNTELWLASGDADFSCDCPYCYEGICKHSVALGLAVLATYGANLHEPGPAGSTGAAVPPATAVLAATALAAAWVQYPEADKLHFLHQALAKNDDLLAQFLTFVNAPVAGSKPAKTNDETNDKPARKAGRKAAEKEPAAPPDPLLDLNERLTETLGALVFDEDFWDGANGYEGYDVYAQNGEMDDIITATLTDALDPFVQELSHLARTGQLTLALRYWATASAAIFQIEEPAADDFEYFEDYGADMLHQWHEALGLALWPGLLIRAVLPRAETAAALAWLGHYLPDPPARWDGFEAHWSEILHVFAAEPALAPALPNLLPGTDFAPETRARLALRLAETTANDTAWVAAAETLLPTDAAVAQRLLAYYAAPATANPKALLIATTTAFATWPDRFGNVVLATYTAASAPALYPAALRHRALANHSLPDFEALRPSLDAPAIAAFVAEARTRAERTKNGLAFTATLLAQESEPADLQKFVFGFEWHTLNLREIEPALHQLALVDAVGLLTELRTRLPAYLNGRALAQRGGALYTATARWLAVAYAAVPALTQPVLEMAQALRDEFPALRLLKEALLKEKLLPEFPVGPGRKAGRP